MMTSLELTQLERIRRAGSMRDLESYLRELKRRRASARKPSMIDDAPQLALPCAMVACRVGGELRIAACLDRRNQSYPSGKRKGAPQHPECEGCVWGKAYAQMAPGYRAKGATLAPEVLPSAQRAAKARWEASRLPVADDAEERDPLRQAAAMTPDDKVIP
jgi:hypothetical protein